MPQLHEPEIPSENTADAPSVDDLELLVNSNSIGEYHSARQAHLESLYRRRILSGTDIDNIREASSFAYQRISDPFDGATPQVAPEVPRAPSFTAAQMVKLARTARNLFKEWSESLTGEDRPRSRRDGEYQESVMQDKVSRFTAEELVYSEIPVPYQWIRSEVLNTIINGFGCNGIRERDGRTYLTCSDCEHDVPPHVAFICSGALYCPQHAPTLEMCTTCNNLSRETTPVTSFDGSRIHICGNCQRSPRRSHCRSCSRDLPLEYYEVGYCESCTNSEGPASVMRRFSYALGWVGKEVGKIVKSKRIFSAEVEAISPSGAHLTKMALSIPIQCGVSGDGSLQTESYGEQAFETQTPRLGGSRGEELVQRLAAAFKETSAHVNASCGLHIHLDGDGIILPSRRERPIALLQLWKAHLVFEDVVMSFLPYARRTNEYCRPMRDSFTVRDLESCSSLLDAEKLWYKERRYDRIKDCKGHHYHSSRYFGVNFHSLLANRHLEIRYHSGTLNAKKILEWANLHSLIMDTAARKLFAFDFLEEAQATTNLREKTKMLFDKIGLAESSQHYFFSRQKKFADKGVNDADPA